jgi:hypothetical protein
MRHATFVLTPLVAAVLVAGCYSVDIAGQTSFNNCPLSAVIGAGQGISDFKTRVQRQTAVAPQDSILDVALTFTTPATQVDRDRIGAYNGTNIATGNNPNSLKAQFRAQDLGRYVSEDTGRLSDAVVYNPACTSE